MDKLVMLSYFFAGFGLFFLGIAALWWVAIYQQRSKKEKK